MLLRCSVAGDSGGDDDNRHDDTTTLRGPDGGSGPGGGDGVDQDRAPIFTSGTVHPPAPVPDD